MPQASPLQVVWFKRDLRMTDHAPLCEASLGAERLLALYVIEPSLCLAEDASGRQLALLDECLRDLADALAERGNRLLRCYGEVTDVLTHIWQRTPFTHLWSHEETGNGLSFQRDIAVAAWCRAHAVAWQEIPQTAVVRRLQSRDQWSAHWAERMAPAPLLAPAQLAPPPDSLRLPSALLTPPAWYHQRLLDDAPLRQRGGIAAAQRALQSFLQQRGQFYRGSLSSPLTAERACSRLSPHLALGCVSIREVLHAVHWRRQALYEMPETERPPNFLASLTAFEARLHWHCHFMQKLESEPALEHENMLRGFDGMREPHFNTEYFARWQAGQTGYPFIDACMRKLQASGWINFRMRAMLVSFAAFPLWLHWRQPGLHLARLFVDFEPGIHWSQMQMQSGTTGINTLRIYNPVKQARDQDPKGVFVRRWVPELAQVPLEYLFEPWLMPTSVQTRAACRLDKDYLLPVVNAEQATRLAKATMRDYRQRDSTRAEAREVFVKHGSRKGPIKRRTATKTTRKKTEVAETQMHFDFHEGE